MNRRPLVALCGAIASALGLVVTGIIAREYPVGRFRDAATAAMTLALCGVMVTPPRLRPSAAALGGGFAVAVSYSILMLAWHFPSDVLGGFLVAALWTLLAVTALTLGRREEPDPSPSTLAQTA